MNTKKMALIVSLGLALVGCNRQNRPPASVSEIGPRITTLMKQHHFNEAAQLGIKSATGKPSDAAIYYFVALAYAERAHYEPDTRDDALKLVSEYSAKSVARDQDNQLNRFNVAWVLEYAGDVDSSSRCKYYADSQELLNQLSSEVSGDAALKSHLAENTSRISQKAKDAHCG